MSYHTENSIFVCSVLALCALTRGFFLPRYVDSLVLHITHIYSETPINGPSTDGPVHL